MKELITFENTEIGFKETLFTIPKLNLERGKLYSLIGKNAAGKSTFFQSLLGIIPFKSGKININQIEISSISALEKAKLFAFVASKFDGVQHLSGLEYVLLGRSPYTNFLGKTSENDLEIVKSIFQNLQITHLEQKETLKMSDGERQILSIAKALAQESKVILLDEPSAFLDYSNRIKVLSLLKQIAFEKDICIVQSSHDLEICLEYSTDFLIINSKNSELILTKNSNLKKEFLIQIGF
jgi:iron complex transport system ATP-binding protein